LKCPQTLSNSFQIFCGRKLSVLSGLKAFSPGMMGELLAYKRNRLFSARRGNTGGQNATANK
jgi:hypothetical protein